MRKEVDILFTSFVGFIAAFILSLGNPLNLFICFGAFMLILRSVFRIKNYNHKLYYILLLPIFVSQGLILTYSYVFRSVYLITPFDNLIFYFYIVIFIALIAIYARYYRHREDYTQIP